MRALTSNSLFKPDIYIYCSFYFLIYVIHVHLSNMPRVVLVVFIIPLTSVFSRDFLVISVHLDITFDYFIRYNIVLYYHKFQL